MSDSIQGVLFSSQPAALTGWSPGLRICPSCDEETPCKCCRLWTRGADPRGYGIAWRGGKLVRITRWTFEQAHGPIPPEMVIMHICDQPACYFLGHLVAGTQRDNKLDDWAKRRALGRFGRQP